MTPIAIAADSATRCRPALDRPVLGAALLLAAVTAGVAGCTAADQDKGDPAQIKRVVGQFADAVDQADVARTVSLLCPEEASAITDSDIPPNARQASAAKQSAKVSDIRIKGNAASVQVARPGFTTTLYLRKDLGVWKVCAQAKDQFSIG